MPDTNDVRPELGVAYFGNRYVGHARSDLAEIADMGASYVVHTMSEADLRWNPGTMRELISAGKDLRLTAWVTPWALGGVFGGEAPSYAVMEHPEACQRDNRGNHLPALCPRQPVFRQLIRDWLDVAAESGAEVCQWDEPHFARQWDEDSGRWSCRCDACQEAFREATHREMPHEWDAEIAEFVHRSLADTVVWCVGEADQRGLGSSIVLLPEDTNDTSIWHELAAQPGVRYFGGTPYWVFSGYPPEDMPRYLTNWCARLMEATAGTHAETVGWIQAFSIPAGREHEIRQGVEIMRASGISSIAVWAFRACSAMSALAPDDPDLVWATVKEAFASTRTPQG
jgi:hypothetical protein